MKTGPYQEKRPYNRTRGRMVLVPTGRSGEMSMDPQGMYFDRAIPQSRRGTLVGQVMGLLAFSMLFTAGGYLVGRALGPAGMIISIIGTLACVLALSFARAKMSNTVALGVFYLFSVFEGMALGLIIDSYI